MTRSPLAYPLNRTADMDAGGAADLQTDIMRFMAILSLCLVAIFALVQSIPLSPVEPAEAIDSSVAAEPAPGDTPTEAAPPDTPSARASVEKPLEMRVTLTRPKWVPKFPTPPEASVSTKLQVLAQEEQPSAVDAAPDAPAAPPVESEAEGFTLRFESDAALTRLVATNRIGVYAINRARSQRMAVTDSRISFWDASLPNSYHEMEAATVPTAVIQALARSGTAASDVHWGVTLPGRLKTKLDELMIEHGGGALVIVSSGDIRWETS